MLFFHRAQIAVSGFAFAFADDNVSGVTCGVQTIFREQMQTAGPMCFFEGSRSSGLARGRGWVALDGSLFGDLLFSFR